MEKILTLLKIVQLANGWPNLKPIHDKAMAELEIIAKDTEKVRVESARQEEAKQAKLDLQPLAEDRRA